MQNGGSLDLASRVLGPALPAAKPLSWCWADETRQYVELAFWDETGEIRQTAVCLVNAFDDACELHQTDGDLIPRLELSECEADVWRVLRGQSGQYREAA